jgi:hypothetical protein
MLRVSGFLMFILITSGTTKLIKERRTELMNPYIIARQCPRSNLSERFRIADTLLTYSKDILRTRT